MSSPKRKREATKIIHYYRKTEPLHSLLPSVKEELKDTGLEGEGGKILSVETESCFNVLPSQDLSSEQVGKLEWLLRETFEPERLCLEKSFLDAAAEEEGSCWKAEFGPRMTFTSAFSSNATSICRSCDLPVERLERSRRYRFLCSEDLSDKAVSALKAMLHDRMTEEEYAEPLTSFDSGVADPKPVMTVPIMSEGKPALEKINKEMGLGFDDFDLDYYTNLFKVCVSLPVCLLNAFNIQIYCPFLLNSTASIENDRKNLDAIPRTWNALIWVSPIQSTHVTGFLVERWSLTVKRSPTLSFKWSRQRFPKVNPTTRSLLSTTTHRQFADMNAMRCVHLALTRAALLPSENKPCTRS